MAKQQINFRIDPSLLEQIREQAEKEGISYTQWIINACLSQLNPDPLVTLDDEAQGSIDTAIQYHSTNIQYSDANIQSAIQDRTPTQNTDEIWDQVAPKVQEMIDQTIISLKKDLEEKASVEHLEGLSCLLEQQQKVKNYQSNELGMME